MQAGQRVQAQQFGLVVGGRAGRRRHPFEGRAGVVQGRVQLRGEQVAVPRTGGAQVDQASATRRGVAFASVLLWPWTLSFRLPGDQRLIGGSRAGWRQSGEVVETTGPGLAPGATATGTFDAEYREVALFPQAFALNDTACAADLSLFCPPRVAPTTASSTTAQTTSRQKAKAPASAAKTAGLKKAGPEKPGPKKPAAPPPRPPR